MDDLAVITKAHGEERILITNDKDFGEKVFRDKLPHHGVILLRLENERATVKIETLRQLLENYADRLGGQYVVATETKVRFARA
jgi:predicted nuclease of predicted toxin-antitoxin system